MSDMYKFQKPIDLDELKEEQWWELEEWFIEYDGKKINTPAGEVAALRVDIVDLELEIKDYKDSRKRQHKNHVRNLKQTVRFLKWVFNYCERNYIGTTGFYALLATDNIDGEENVI